MYEMIDATPKEIFLAYAVIIGGLFGGFLLVNLIFETLGKGVSRWWK